MSINSNNYAEIKDEQVRMLVEERYYLWRAIDLLVSVLHNRGDIPEWFRDDWSRLLRERQTHSWALLPPEEPSDG